MKLSQRLTLLKSIACDAINHNHYDHVWDVCCDHGYLGEAILENTLLSHKSDVDTAELTLHFVDIVPHVLDTLEQRLTAQWPAFSRYWQCHCLDGAHLPFNHYQGRHLVILAGIGGDLMIHMIQSLLTRYPDLAVDFLLCPVHHQYALREQLIRSQLHLQSEELLEENKRFYEVLFVMKNTIKGSDVMPNIPPALTNVGEKIWHANNEQQLQVMQRYLDKTLAHYKRCAIGGDADAENIVSAYQAVKLQFSE
ncbi:MAG: tRNA (adenine(22)-N(1))-methyltransferase TrmK [Oleibacter sp.]|nr:tRNA (adenine(22)-N(1))-methyltransferase TrmK [Thalassolituus sp.]